MNALPLAGTEPVEIADMDGIEDPTSQSQPAPGSNRGIFSIVVLGALWILAAALLVPPAGFTIDDFIYHTMIDAFARNGSLFVENGFAEYGVDALRLRLLQDTNGQLAPQYPGGWGIIASPAYILAGLRGVIVMNAIASAFTLLFVWQAAWYLFQDRQLATRATLIFGLATFAVDYALGFWPHGVATCIVAAAIAAVAKSTHVSADAQIKWTFLAGLLIGIGVNIRVDVLFAAAPICIWLLGTSHRPYSATASLLAGLLPGMIAAATINWIKFGILSPVTYGSAGGGTTFAHYAQLAPFAIAGALASIALGLPKIRALLHQPKLVALIGAAGLMLGLLVPALRDLLMNIGHGFWILMFDFQDLPRPSHGLTELPDGTIRMWGLVKKAMLQSLPYAAVIVVLAPRLFRGPDRAALALCFLFIVIAALPFAYGSWHGGMSNNMRYLLNLLPVLAILSAAALREIEHVMGGNAVVGLICALAVIVFGALFPLSLGVSPDFVFQNTLPNALIAAIVILSVGVMVTRSSLQAVTARALYALTLVGLLTATVSALYFDLAVNFSQRHLHHTLATKTADLPANALVVSQAQIRMALRVNRPPALSAYASNEQIDAKLTGLIADCFKEGRPVFAQGRLLADLMVSKNIAGSHKPRYGLPETIDVFELTPPGSSN